MALERKYQKIFGKNAVATDLGVVGSKSIDNPQYSTDIETLQSLSNWETGMRAIVTSSSAPYLQDHNSLFYVITSQLAYIFQSGIAEWNSQTEYIANRSVVLRNGKTYIAIANSTNIEPIVTSGWESYWKSLTDWGFLTGDINEQKDLISAIGKGYYAVCNTASTTMQKDITISNLVLDDSNNIPDGTKITVEFANGSDCLLYSNQVRTVLHITTGSGITKNLYVEIGGSVSAIPEGLRHKKLFCPNSISNIITFTVYNKIYAVSNNCVVKDRLNVSSGGFQWAREYLDGFVEQGGEISSSGTNVSLIVNMADTHYSAIISDSHTRTNSSFSVASQSGNTMWEAKGYRA